VHHDARLAGEFLDRNTELACGIVEQYAAHLGTHDAERPIIARHGVGAGSIHHAAKARIAVDLVDRRCRYDADLAPVGIELFGVY